MIIRRKAFGLAEKLAGRRVFYHGTSEESAESIRKEGIKSSHAQDKNCCTRTMLSKHNPDSQGGMRGKMTDFNGDYDNLIYVTERKGVADFMTEHNKRRGRGGETLKISVPYSVHRNYKTVANPEFGKIEFIHDRDKLSRKIADKPYEELSRKEKEKIKSYLKMQESNWVMKDTDIPSKYVKGSRDYERVTPKEILMYQKAKLTHNYRDYDNKEK